VPPAVVWVPVVPPVVRPAVPAVVWFAVPPVEWFAVPPFVGRAFVVGLVPVLGLLAPPAGFCAAAGFAGAAALGALPPPPPPCFCADTTSGMTITANSKNATLAGHLEIRVGFTLSPWHLKIFLPLTC
jgi:hypothetical protein